MAMMGPPLPVINLYDDEDGDEGAGGEAPGDDGVAPPDYLHQARDIALRNPRVTSPMLEKRFKIRKSQADEIIDQLRAEGLVIGG